MNKNLLILILLASCSLSSCDAMADDGKFYLKMGTGINKIAPVKFDNNEFKGKIKLANNFPLIEAGVGYQLTDSIRTELVYNHYFLFHSNETSTNRDQDIYKIAYKTKINTLMLNGYKDIMTFGNCTPFIGGGIGIGNLKDKASGNVLLAANNKHYLLEPSSAKRVNRFAYKLTLGVDIKLSDNVKAELTYNYSNLGYNRPKIIDGVDNLVRRNYKVHNITTSIRYSL